MLQWSGNVMDATEDLARVLDEFGHLPRQVQPEPTFMEVAGYPHWENAATNILAFFLDPQNGTGLEGLILGSLLAAVRSPVEQSHAEPTSVTPYAPASGKFIDLLVETESVVVGVENKIYAPLGNPLREYAQQVRHRAGDRKEPVLILLTLRGLGAATDLSGFQIVLYDNFVGRVLDGIGPLLPAANPRYVGYLLDFVRTLQNLARRSEVSAQFREFVKSNVTALVQMQEELDVLRREAGRKLTEMSASVEAPPVEGLLDVDGPRSRDSEWRTHFAPCQFWDLRDPAANKTIYRVNVFLSPFVWRIVACRWDGGDITSLLQDRGFSSTPDDWDGYQQRHPRVCGTSDYNEDPGKVAVKVKGVIDALRR
jgi:hypothetical protein